MIHLSWVSYFKSYLFTSSITLSPIFYSIWLFLVFPVEFLFIVPLTISHEWNDSSPLFNYCHTKTFHIGSKVSLYRSLLLQIPGYFLLGGPTTFCISIPLVCKILCCCNPLSVV